VGACARGCEVARAACGFGYAEEALRDSPRAPRLSLGAMDPGQARELLAHRRAEIERKLPGLSPREGAGDADDQGDAADVAPELVDAGLADALGEQLREELEAIERAERRLAEGTYGLSVESGEPIPDARLVAIPWAERTAQEQARYEQSRR